MTRNIPLAMCAKILRKTHRHPNDTRIDLSFLTSEINRLGMDTDNTYIVFGGSNEWSEKETLLINTAGISRLISELNLIPIELTGLIRVDPIQLSKMGWMGSAGSCKDFPYAKHVDGGDVVIAMSIVDAELNFRFYVTKQGEDKIIKKLGVVNDLYILKANPRNLPDKHPDMIPFEELGDDFYIDKNTNKKVFF